MNVSCRDIVSFWGRRWSEFIGDYGTSVKYTLEIQIPPKVWCLGMLLVSIYLLRRYLDA